jgi:hypothetical protein
VVVSHSEGRSFSTHQKSREPELRPHNLPDSGALEKLAGNVGLNLESCTEEASLFVAVLRVSSVSKKAVTHLNQVTQMHGIRAEGLYLQVVWHLLKCHNKSAHPSLSQRWTKAHLSGSCLVSGLSQSAINCVI